MKIKPEVGVTAEDDEVVVGSIDIAIIYSLGDEPDLRLECKRVSAAVQDNPKSLARYCVKGGVLRFLGKYGWGHRWGVMIGFVLDGNCTAAAILISEYVTTYRNQPSHLIGGWEADQRFGQLPHLFSTCHLKQNGDPLELFHLFLPFSSTSAL